MPDTDDQPQEWELEDLLEGVTREDFAMTDEDRQWHDMKPAGREII